MTVVQSTRQLDLREKLLIHGVASLSDSELLAVFISSGNKQRTCLELANDLMNQYSDLRALLNSDLNQFQLIPGLGIVRYTQLQAVKEMCRRSDFIQLKRDSAINNSRQTYSFLKRRLRDNKHETFAALYLDNQHRVIAYEELFSGTINSASVHSRPIVERVLQLNAAALILAHNHPSGVSDASQQDIEVTARIKQALELIDARLLDHIVIGDNEVYSIIAEHKWACN
ncbi:RadC family protein [Legionella waltersii]|uniref:DNA repair protein RadC n=1 Tax=Legionella waltersii TaxID=66969 RepID=A0A0W1ADE5_9GAMM|nr:DNA repair protein RadC [Legionella waltersii]KTD79353.1 DNA repair protein RadC [Legionella waltersii]SNU99901.1 DNA repair protein RadC [Legionella waltersii]